MRALAKVGWMGAFVATVACNARAGGTPAPTTSSTATITSGTEANADVRQVTIPVDGMSCGACAARLKKALKELHGVVDAEVSLEHANARIRYVSTHTSPDKLVSAIKGLGFTPGAPSASS
jgi:copper chaperone CopZ